MNLIQLFVSKTPNLLLQELENKKTNKESLIEISNMKGASLN